MENINYDQEIERWYKPENFKSNDSECTMSPDCGCDDCEKEKVKMD